MNHHFKTKVSLLMRLGMVLLPAISVGSTNAWSQSQYSMDGKNLLEARCSRCHAVGTEEVSKHPEAPQFRDLGKKYAVENLAEALAEGIFTGHPDIPVFEFDAREVEQIITYLESFRLGKGAFAQADRGSPRVCYRRYSIEKLDTERIRRYS